MDVILVLVKTNVGFLSPLLLFSGLDEQKRIPNRSGHPLEKGGWREQRKAVCRHDFILESAQ